MQKLSTARVFVSLSVLFAAPLITLAQVNTATILGSITDPTQAAVPGAQAELKNDLTGVTTQTTSNSDGQFTFTFVPVGKYTLTVRHPGFNVQVRPGLNLSAGMQLSLNIALQLSTSTETVTVSGGAPLLNLASSDQHTTMSNQNVKELPLAKLDWTRLLSLGNGITKAGNGGVALNGLAPGGINLTVDGTNASADPELPSLGFYQGFNVINTINTDAIQEISTTKGIAPASVAGSMSGNINIITKGGTNQFHGSLFEFNSVADYNARNQFLSTNPGATFNQFGGSLGGPIFRDRLFFFADYEAVRSHSFSAISDNVPTPEFVASVLKVAPEYAPVFAVFPQPTQGYAAGATTGQYFGTGSLVQNDENAVLRFDYYVKPTDLVTLRYTRSRPDKDQPRSISVNPRVTTGHGDVYNAQYTHSGTSWTATTRIGYNRLYLDRLDEGFGVGLDQVKFGFDSQGAEAFEKLGSTKTGEETFALTRGRHTIQMGVIVQRQNAGRTDNNTNSFSFSTLDDFLADIPSQIQINFPLLPFQLHTYQLGGFVQDDFRVSRNLTLNLGIRYDYFTVPKERDGRIFNRATTALGPGFGPFQPPSQMYNADYNNFAPRIGFAWSLGSGRKTVVRGGAGIFVNPHPIFGGPIEEPLTAPNIPFRLTLNRAQALAMNLRYPLDTNALLQQLESTGAPIANTTIGPNFPNPYSMQWTLGIQRELGAGVVLDTAYVGNRGLHLNMIRMENLPDRITGVAPDPTFGSFRFYDGSDASRYDALQVSLRKRFAMRPKLGGLDFGVTYTYASNTSFGDADLQLQSPPQDGNNIRADHGPTPYDQRHVFNANFLYELPFLGLTGASSRPAKLALGGWQISGILTASTGFPVNVTNGNSSYPSDRPDLVPGVDPTFSNYTSTLSYLNPAAFVGVPIVKASGAGARPGDLGRYALRAPGAWNLDASLAKNFELTERFKLQLRGDLFNAFNHTNLGGLVANISKSTFGRLTSATSRSIQIGARLTF